MSKIGIILASDNRSKAYIQKLVFSEKKLDKIILLNDKKIELDYSENEIEISKKYGFDISKPVKEFLQEREISFKEFDFVDINHPELIKYVKNNQLDFYIFTGGGVLKKPILNSGTKFIHLHPGIVPQYRGSTCFYYSILNDGNCGVTAYVMEEKLDAGNIIFQKKFQAPKHKFLDTVFDPHIRSNTLIEMLENNLLDDCNFKKQDKSEGDMYFIIHPILKHLAILKCLIND